MVKDTDSVEHGDMVGVHTEPESFFCDKCGIMLDLDEPFCRICKKI